MAELGVGQKPVLMNRYPGLMLEDADVWEKYLSDPFQRLEKVWYDVRVGEAVPLPSDADELDMRISAAVTRKRIDVVAWVDQVYWVIELKPFANYVALGQVVTYSRLFSQEFPKATPLLPVVIAALVDVDIVDSADNLGVLLIEV